MLFVLEEVPYGVLESRYADSDASESDRVDIAATSGSYRPARYGIQGSDDEYDSDYEDDQMVHQMNAALKQGREGEDSHFATLRRC